MGLSHSEHGKGFVYSIMVSTVLLILLILLAFSISLRENTSWKYISAHSLDGMASSIVNDAHALIGLNYSCGEGECVIEDSPKNHSESVPLIIKDAERGFALIGVNASMDVYSLNTTDTLCLWSDNTTYCSNHTSKNIKITGFNNISHTITGPSTCTLTENCVEGAGKHIQIELAGCSYNNTVTSSSCSIILSVPGANITFDYTPNQTALDYSQYAGEIHVITKIGTNDTLWMSGPRTQGSTASTTNPGYTEPDYPDTFSSIKHYGSITINGTNYNLIVCDYQNDSAYDYYYISDSSDFSGKEPHRTGSAMFLNNKVFVITVNMTGNSVTAHDSPGMRVEKGSQKIVRPL